MDIVRFAPGGDYERYEELTLKKDHYEKEAEHYRLAYVREFGDLIAESFGLKVECIALKKEIALYIKARNAGRTITPEEVKAYLEARMSVYEHELQQMIEENEASKNIRPISFSEVEQIKKIYRRLAKLLHPDISPLTVKYPALGDLFRKIIVAYKSNDLKELRKLEVLVNKELEDNGVEGFDMVIPDIAERIDELERDVDAIISSAPYTYRELLRDEEAVNGKKAELRAEIEEYTGYKKELSEKLREIKEDGPWPIKS